MMLQLCCSSLDLQSPHKEAEALMQFSFISEGTGEGLSSDQFFIDSLPAAVSADFTEPAVDL